MGITAAVTAAVVTISSALVSGYGQWKAGNAAKDRGNYIGDIYDDNARVADSQSEDAIARGYETEFQFRSKTKGVLGAQRVGLAAQGIDIDTGSARDVRTDAEMFSEADALTIRNNARREAMGFKVEASNLRKQGTLARKGGQMEQIQSRWNTGTTLLTGGLQAYEAKRRYA